MDKETIFDASATTEQGCEEFLQQELKERFKIQGEIGENWVNFKATPVQIAEVMYSSQATKRLVLKILEGTFHEIDELGDQLRKISDEQLDFLSGILKEKTTRVVCDRTGGHDFNSLEAEHITSATFKEMFSNKGKEFKISLDKPNIIIYLRIFDDKYVLGIDCAGRELSKRQHLVFNNANAIKGTTSFAALLYAGYKPGMLLLDPFSLSGNVSIEAALIESGMSLNYYTKKFTLLELDEFRPIVEEVMKKADAKIKAPYSKPRIISSDALFNNVAAQKKNAKIAGIDKYIAFSRTDIENIDIKTFEEEIDVICSRVIESSSHFAEDKARRIYVKLFENLKFITKKKTSFVFVLRNPELLEEETEKQGYELEGRKQVWQGQQPYFLVKMKRKE
ncbi:MAG: THUMP domain-containing protein [Candidatus Nanoarchaeia archaeon]